MYLLHQQNFILFFFVVVFTFHPSSEREASYAYTTNSNMFSNFTLKIDFSRLVSVLHTLLV